MTAQPLRSSPGSLVTLLLRGSAVVVALEGLIAAVAAWVLLGRSTSEAAVLVGVSAASFGMAIELASLSVTPRTRRETLSGALLIVVLAIGVLVMSDGFVSAIVSPFLPTAGVVASVVAIAAAGAVCAARLRSP